MIKVAALTGGRNTPSARFRIRQYIEPLREAGIEVHEYVPVIDKYAGVPSKIEAIVPYRMMATVSRMWEGAKLGTRIPGVLGSWRAQITWVSKGLIRGYFSFESLLKRPLVFDADDATWLARPHGRFAMQKIAAIADVIVAGNSYIADWFSARARDVRIVPTAIDTSRFRPRRDCDSRMEDCFVIGWTGISGNFHYLYNIEKPLAEFLNTHDAQLLVVADRPPSFERVRTNKTRYIQWSPDVEAEAVRQMDVGLMPLSDTPWTRGKCSFKMLQYMACAVPVIVSPVGMNSEILSMGSVGLPAGSETDWCEGLELVYNDREAGHKWGKTGRLIVERHFSKAVISQALARIFNELE